MKATKANKNGKRIQKKDQLDRQSYRKHFHIAVLSLEQNMMEEYFPELRNIA